MAEQQTIKLELTIAQVNVILGSIAKQPLEAVLDTFNAIQQQAGAQMNSPAGPLADKVL